LQERIFSLGISIVILCVVLAFVFPSGFPTLENFSQLLLNLSIDTIVAIGMMILLIAGTLLLASYHYLVRSTFLGKLLNGRKYPRSFPLTPVTT